MEKALGRQRVLLQHLQPTSQTHESTALSASNCAGYHRTAAFDDDVVIVAAYRTAICKSQRGGFKDTPPEDLLAPVLKALIEKTNLNPSEVGDIVVGTVLAPGSQRATECRMAAFFAGFPGLFSRFNNFDLEVQVESHKRAAAAISSGKFRDEIIPVSTKASVEALSRALIGSFAAVGVDPAVMGIGPAAAIPVAVKAAGLELDDIDIFEINEAFASQFVYCCKKLELNPENVNVNGGAIALGHPLGATGARCVATILNEMKRRGKDCRFGVISMCIGTGMGAAAVFERGDCIDVLCNARPVECNSLLSRDAR
ncbi:3-ketoacyl-CoA thiolase 2 peroxisomal [Tripterygium wilfordii]|uniref:acetyl-CoA C-acyltransferase n=1 Tax=Tripterygium wilfordii TaxID=458696 RepID=A0A7J7D4I4_TRIWF|nr:3-ketoacyl-CoA thiolase 2 peroxisomal [Tripterygium wilfordii]